MKFYTYAHYTKDTSELFYIGKGQGKRYKQQDTTTRNRWWQNKVKKHGGFTSVILCYWENEQDAFEHEKLLISIFEKQLVNLTKGGEGVSGIKASDETRKKISKALTGRTVNEQTCKNISKALKGRKLSEKHALRSRQVLLDAQEKKKKKIVCITTNTKYNSVSEASKFTGVDASSIVRICKGKQKQAAGMVFLYDNS